MQILTEVPDEIVLELSQCSELGLGVCGSLLGRTPSLVILSDDLCEYGMDYSQNELKSLIQNPRESLDTEIKQWIEPSTLEGIAKIAKACIALRNNNGGCLVIGFTDAGKPDISNMPEDVRASFRADAIQGIVTKYASQAFEVRVEFVERDGIEYPVICVPGGVEYPVAAKSDLVNGNDRPLIKTDTVYVRSLNANNVASSTAIRWRDWERVIRIFFSNKQADLGAFLRRHLTGLDVKELSRVLATQTIEDNEEVGRVDLLAAFHDQNEWLPKSVCDGLDTIIGEYSHASTAKDVAAASIALRQAVACLSEYLATRVAESAFRHALVELVSLIAEMAAYGREGGNQDLFWTLGNHYIVTLHNLLAENEDKC